MRVVTVNVSFPKQLLKAMDAIAKQQSRSRSELLRTAVLMYVERRKRWERLTSFWQAEAKRAGLKPKDVPRLIAEYRREQMLKS
jgi:predicted transcriptional regulator